MHNTLRIFQSSEGGPMSNRDYLPHRLHVQREASGVPQENVSSNSLKVVVVMGRSGPGSCPQIVRPQAQGRFIRSQKPKPQVPD